MHIISAAVWRIVGGRLVAAAHQNALTVFELLIAGVNHLVAAGSHLFPADGDFCTACFYRLQGNFCRLGGDGQGFRFFGI